MNKGSLLKEIISLLANGKEINIKMYTLSLSHVLTF